MTGRGSRVVRLLAAASTMLVASGAGHAQSCNVSVSGALAFGVYAFVTPVDGATTLTVRCSQINQAPGRSVNYSVRLTSGPGSFVNRLMSHATLPGETLGFNLYRDAARSLVWGDGTAGSTFPIGQFVFNPPASGNTQQAQHTVYGRIPANQNPAAGNYQSSSPITVIMEY